MYRVGYIDDEPEQFVNYKKKIARENIELVLLDKCNDMREIIDKIYELRLEALLIDYKLANYYNFSGTSLVNYISDNIHDFACYIMTAIDTEIISDKIVEKRSMYSKSIFDTEGDNSERVEKFEKFAGDIKDSVEVFRSRRDLKLEEYKKLLADRKQRKLSAAEEERYIKLYKVLVSYGMVEEMPENMLKTSFDDALNELLMVSKKILDNN